MLNKTYNFMPSGTDYFVLQAITINRRTIYLIRYARPVCACRKNDWYTIRVNTLGLSIGTYPWQIVYKNKVVESGKWVKE